VILVFSYVGFETQEVEVGSRTTIDISMGGAVELSEVVVTALGVQRDEKALGYAVQEVSSDAIINSGASSAVDALVGKASGVQITRSSGAAGGGSRILIRGNTSMVGNNQPIIVIDGVRTNNDTDNTTESETAGTAQSNRLMDLNPEDIESINILKGAAAAALYGTAGATGVVLITTKRGTKGSGLSVNFTSQIAFDEVTTIPELQGIYAQGAGGSYRDPSTGASGSWGPRISDLEYATDRNTYAAIYDREPEQVAAAFFADGTYKYDKNGFLVPKGEGNGKPANNYNDQQEEFWQTGVTLTNSLSISGGSDKATFRFSVSDHNQSGITPNEEYLRKTAKVATSLNPTDALKFNASLNYTRSDHTRIQQGSNTSGLLLGMYRTPASFDNRNGFSAEDAVDEPSAYIFPDGAQRNYRGGGGYDNPYWTVNNTLRDEEVHRIFGNFQTDYSISSWLNFGLNIGVDITTDNRKQDFEINSRTNTSGTVILDKFNTTQTDFYFNISGQGELNQNFSLNYLFGLNLFSYDNQNVYTQGDALVFQNFIDISNATNVSSSENDTRYRTLGLYGSVEGNFKNIAFLTLTGRQDYDSRLVVPGQFDASNVGFFYPSASTSIVLSELIPENNVLSFAKARVSWAQVGSPPPFEYLTATYYENTVGIGDGWGPNLVWPINKVTSFELDETLGNASLEPEITTTTEYGLDVRFLNGRVGLDVTYFDRTTEDAILNASVAASSGYTSSWVNAGRMTATGWEVTLNASPISNSLFRWDTQLNFTTNETIVEELAPGIERLFLAGFSSSGSYLVKGNPYGAIFAGVYLREQAGTDADKDLNIPDGAIVINSDPSDVEYGYQEVDDKQRAVGDPNPDFIIGWNNSFSYKNWSVGALLDWRKGGDLWNGTAWALSFFGRSQLTADTREEAPIILPGVIKNSDETFSPNNIPIVRDQSYWTSNVGGFGAVGEQFVQDGGWIRLREVSLTYRFPSQFLGQGFIKGGSIGFIGRNLWYDWSYDGVDPETSLTGTGNGQGFDYFNQPGTKTYIFRLSLNF
ncbi:MAG: SusC/RagA family TonB-linked outer membrane protein, partial [Ekhidna sp.]|nr:SusC/RagA family TonB-linked outer membrane protein [Ekhidna sp.]